MRDVTYVRHIVTAPEARGSGVGRTLMAAIAERARAAACSTWCLNVKPDNTSAIALYERFGLTRAFETRALRVAWSLVGPKTDLDAAVTARTVTPGDDARMEPAMKLLPGQLDVSRRMKGRVLMGLFEGDTPVAVTVFDPNFPGAYPFRAARPELAFALLRAIRGHARPTDDLVNVVVEGEPAVADALLAGGATIKLDIVHMKGPLPAA